MTTKYLLAPNLVHCYRRVNGEPLTTDGWLYTFKDTDHNTPKAIYECSNGTCPYANPVPITANGTLPLMYWADDEQYYIELYDGKKDEGGELINSFEHFPDLADDPDNAGQDERNYFDNPEFRKFLKASYETADLPANIDTYIADEGWFYNRNNTNATNKITFKAFTPGQVIVHGNPKYYLEFECEGFGAGGESRSDIFMKIDDVSIFSGESISFGVWGESSTTSNIELIIAQNFGDGGDAAVITSSIINLTQTWEQHVIDGFSIPSVNGKNIQDGNYLAIGLKMPLNQISDVRVTKFQLNRGTDLLFYDLFSINQENMKKRAFELPDCSDEDLYSHPSWQGTAYDPQTFTGLIGMGFESERKEWKRLDGATLKTLDSVPNTDDRLTYRRLWDWWEENLDTPAGGISSGNGNAFGYGDNGFRPTSRSLNNQCTIRNTKSDFAVTTWTDNNTGFTINKLQNGGDYGINCFSSFDTAYDNSLIYTHVNNSTISIQNKVLGVAPDATVGDMPAPFSVTVQTQGSPTVAENTRISYWGIADTTTLAGKYWTFDTPSAAYYVWHKVDGVGADPSVGGRIGILVEFDTLVQPGSARVASEALEALRGKTLHGIIFNAASTLSGGEYFNIYNDGEHYTPYYIVDSVGDDPGVGGATGIPINVEGTDDAETVRNKTVKEIKAIYFQVPNPQGMAMRITDYTTIRDPDLDDRDERGDSIVNRYPGTIQRDDTRSHRHTNPSDMYNGSSASVSSPPDPERWDQKSDYVGYTGGSETRMVNININLFVKL